MNKIDLIINALECAIEDKFFNLNKYEKALGAARELKALLQPKQELGKCGCGANLYIDEEGKPCSKVLAQPEQEPVAWMQDSVELYVKDFPSFRYTIPLYTAPPKREWVGLHLNDMPETYVGDKSFLQGAKWAEVKLKEKNT